MSCRCKTHKLECDGYGDSKADFMFVGLSAGKLGALITKVPFTKDGSGRLLQRILLQMGFSTTDEKSIKPNLKNVYITNLAKGRYLDDKGNNRLPTKDEVYDWFEYIEKEISQVKPKIIIALGKLVFETLNDNYPNVVYAKHPRWYFSHGGINIKSKASKQMLNDYEKILCKIPNKESVSNE